MQPTPLVAFISTHSTKASCEAAVEEMKERVPKERAEDVVCLQVVLQDRVKDF